jgi:hypothetical protein
LFTDLVEVDVHALELQVGAAGVAVKIRDQLSDQTGIHLDNWDGNNLHTGLAQAMLSRDGVPESGTDLVTLWKM